MTSREIRKQRREAERKARKLAYKEAKANPVLPLPQTQAAAAARLAEMDAQADRELEAEFGAEFIAHARELSERIARRAGLEIPARNRAETNTASLNTLSSSSPRGQTDRQNAQFSTGPKTPEGKLASSRNSLKHGLSTGTLIVPGEDLAEFETLRDDLLREHQPANATEEMLVQQLAQSYWLLQRAIRFQNECFTAEGVDEKRLALFLRYGAAHERAFHKALNALLRAKKDRPKAQSAPRATQPKDDGFVSQKEVSLSPEPFSVEFVSQNNGFSVRLSNHGAPVPHLPLHQKAI